VLRARALLLVVLALVLLASTEPVAAARPPADLKVARKTAAQKEKQPSKPPRPTPEGKKKEDTTITLNKGTIDPIGPLTRGQTVEIHATALRTGELCALQMFYADRATKVIREVVPDEKKRCVFSVQVPDRPTAVGAGKAKLILTKATSGKKSGEASQVFSVV